MNHSHGRGRDARGAHPADQSDFLRTFAEGRYASEGELRVKPSRIKGGEVRLLEPEPGESLSAAVVAGPDSLSHCK